jgi:acetyl esterase
MKYAFDPELVPLLEMLPELLPDANLDISDPVASRAAFCEMSAALNAELDTSGVIIEDRQVPGPAGAPDVAVRIYTPEGLEGEVPGLLHIHGGGFVIGDLETEHGACVALCRNLGIVVVSVDYRLAPETPYPGGLEDCYAALQWVGANCGALHIDLDRLGIFGQSAPPHCLVATGAAPKSASSSWASRNWTTGSTP